MQSTDTRNEIKQLARTLESLAREVQTKLDAGDNILLVANELARNSSTFVFTLGEMYALEQVGSSRKVKARGTSTSTLHNYHNVRDSLGRFTRKI